MLTLHCGFHTLPNHRSRSSALATTRDMLDVHTPICLAISAHDRPSSSTARRAIVARVSLTTCRLLPAASSAALIFDFSTSCFTMRSIVKPVRRCFTCLNCFSSASLRTAWTTSPCSPVFMSVSRLSFIFHMQDICRRPRWCS